MKNTPHDELFTRFMVNTESAKKFIDQYLPKDLLDKINLKYFEDITTKFQDERIDDYYTDLVFRTKINNDMQQEVYFCFLFEHKSYLDKNVALQILDI